MASVLIRNLDPDTIARLKQTAVKRGLSLTAHVKMLLEAATKYTMAGAAASSRAMRSRFAGRRFPDSATLIGKDRRR